MINVKNNDTEKRLVDLKWYTVKVHIEVNE